MGDDVIHSCFQWNPSETECFSYSVIPKYIYSVRARHFSRLKNVTASYGDHPTFCTMHIIVYVFLLLVYVFLLLSMYSYCCLCILRRGYPD